MDPDTHPLVMERMGDFIKRFNGVHLNKILDIQGKDITCLPTMPEHLDATTGKSTLSYHKLMAGYCPGLMPECKFHHLPGGSMSQPSVEALCREIEPGIQKIMHQGYLPASNKRGGGITGRSQYPRCLFSVTTCPHDT